MLEELLYYFTEDLIVSTQCPGAVLLVEAIADIISINYNTFLVVYCLSALKVPSNKISKSSNPHDKLDLELTVKVYLTV